MCANLRVFTRGGECKSLENSDFEAKIRVVNSVSGEKLHDFEIICPASWMRSHPLAYGPGNICRDWLCNILSTADSCREVVSN